MGLRAELKTATQADHEKLDRVVSRWDLSHRDSYAEFLLMHSALLPPLEQWLERSRVETFLPDWPVRQRRGALQSDLAALSAPPLAPARIELRPSLPSVAGVLYVLEGSRLGGKLLVRRVVSAGEAMPVAFLGHRTGGQLWQIFLNWLDSQSFCSASRREAVSSARSVFDLYTATAKLLLKEIAE